MAEQEKKPEKNLDADAWKKAINSWRKRASDTDFDELDSQMTEELVNKLHEGLRRNRKCPSSAFPQMSLMGLF